MITYDDIREVCSQVNLHYATTDLRQRYQDLKHDSIKLYFVLFNARNDFIYQLESCFQRSKLVAEGDISSYYRAYCRFISTFTDLSHCVYEINSLTGKDA